MNIKELLENIHQIKKIQEESWDGVAYESTWRDIIPTVITDVVAADMAAVLLSQAWNDCEDWLNYYNKAQSKFDVKDIGKGRSIITGDPINILGRGMWFNRTNSPDLWLAQYNDGSQSLLYAHEFEITELNPVEE